MQHVMELATLMGGWLTRWFEKRGLERRDAENATFLTYRYTAETVEQCHALCAPDDPTTRRQVWAWFRFRPRAVMGRDYKSARDKTADVAEAEHVPTDIAPLLCEEHRYSRELARLVDLATDAIAELVHAGSTYDYRRDARLAPLLPIRNAASILNVGGDAASVRRNIECCLARDVHGEPVWSIAERHGLTENTATVYAKRGRAALGLGAVIVARRQRYPECRSEFVQLARECVPREQLERIAPEMLGPEDRVRDADEGRTEP